MTTMASAWELAARSFEQRERWLYGPALWVRDCVDFGSGSLAPYQDEVMSALVTTRRVAVRAPHGTGKTSTVALVVLWFALTRDQVGYDWKVLTTASAWRQLTLYLWPEIHKWSRRLRWDVLGRSEFDARRELLDLHLKLRSGAASAVASDDPAKLEGAHADSLLYIFDEAKTIPAPTWDAVEGAFSGGRSTGLPEAFALAMSTPGAPTGRFYDIHKRARGLDDWHTRHITLTEAIAAGRISPAWAEQRAVQWGPESAMYANRVLGEFHAGEEDAVIPLSWVEAAVDRWLAWDDAGRPPLPGRRLLGVDVARGGGDSTVIAHRMGPCITHLDVHHAEDTMRSTARVQVALEPDVTAVVDSIGVGAGVVDRLRELKEKVVAYTGSAKTTAKTRGRDHGFVNVRTAAWWRLRELLDPSFDPEVMLPPDDLLLADLTAPTWSEQTGIPPRIKLETKEDLVARLGRSPDRGDAVVMAFWAASGEGGAGPGAQVLADTNLLTWGRPR